MNTSLPSYSNTDVLSDVSEHIIDQCLKVRPQIIGLGSGSTIAALVRKMHDLSKKELYTFIVSSLQIKLETENSGLKIVDENHITCIDMLFDGADQIDSEYNMIKGGGGALLKEKILFSAAKKVVIVAASSKFTNNLNRPVPVEVHPFARTIVPRRLAEINGGGNECKLRTIEKGYPFITENGNIIFDVIFKSITHKRNMESEIKNIPGVIEVGLFTKPADIYYLVKPNGSFDVIKL